MPAQRKYISLQNTRSEGIGFSSGKSSLRAGTLLLEFSGVILLGDGDINMTE